MAPVMSSVTVACCVRSPSATACSSFISRRIAAWFASLTRLASRSWRSASRRCTSDTDARWRWSAVNTSSSPRPPSNPSSSDRPSSPTLNQPMPPTDDTLDCTLVRPCRSVSVSAMMAVSASRAETRPCRLPRMAPACVRSASCDFSSASSRARICGSLVAVRRRSGLPSSRPRATSRKVLRSLPSRNSASGDTPSTVSDSLADLPMRCVSITSRPAADTSVGSASCCTLAAAMASVESSNSPDWRLIAFSACPTWVSSVSWASTMPAFFSVLSTTASSGSTRPRVVSETACRPASACPLCRPRTLAASTAVDSRTSAKAWGCPASACSTALASRCDCIRACPVAPICAELPPAERTAITDASTRPSPPSASNPPSRRCCRSDDQPPISGNRTRAPSGARRGDAPEDGRRSWNGTRRLDGEASLMMEPSGTEMVVWSDASWTVSRRSSDSSPLTVYGPA